MRILVDTDVLLDDALDREPWAEAAVALLDYCLSGRATCFVSWHSLATVFYYASDDGKQAARDFIAELLDFAHVAPVGHEDMLFALEQEMSDFEDAMQVAAAVACRASRIVTRNVRDYKKSLVPALTPAEFLKTLGA